MINNFQFSIFNSQNRNLQPNSGQVILILVLVTIIGLTVGLSLISRTVTDIRISSQVEESAKAFGAAEAGVESALRESLSQSNTSPTGTVSLPGSSAVYQVNSIGGGAASYSLPLTTSGKDQTLWLIEHNTDGMTLNETATAYSTTSGLDICWGTIRDTVPAVVLSLFYKDGSDYKIAKAAYDPDLARSVTNNFNAVTDTAGGYCNGNFKYRKTITAQTDFDVSNVSALLLFIRIQMIYADSAIGAHPSSDLPTQGKQITSLGQTDKGVVRKVSVIKQYPSLPEIFNYTFICERNCT